MKRLVLIPLLVLALPRPSAHADPLPSYVAAREIVLEYRTANAVAVGGADLWVSTDRGRTWRGADAEPAGQRSLRYTAAADGRYDFYVVLRNAAGTSADPPVPGTTPTVSIIVDTTPPLLQIHSAQVETIDDEAVIRLKVSLVEEHLADGGLRVFYRTTPGQWQDGGTATVDNGALRWAPPASVHSAELDVRCVATDLAGNHCAAQAVGIALPSPRADAPASQPAATQPALTSAPAEVAPDGPLLADATQLQHLRTLAARFMSEGRYDLAAARYEDAVALAPHDADLLVDLGGALYRAGRLTEANTRFDAARSALPEHAGAIEGLALVAATERRYAQARAHLQQLQRLRPDSGLVWLRAGDVEHRLGNTAQALAAWRRVLTAADADADLRAKAQRRLEYFDPEHAATPGTAPTDEKCPSDPPIPPSSSSTGTIHTRNPRP